MSEHDVPPRPPTPSAQPSRAKQEVSAGGVVVRFVDGQPFYLVIRDSYRNWGFPKGHLETGESAEDAALREVAEETGVKAGRSRGPIQTIEWYFRFRGKLVHKVCHFFLIETHDAFTTPQREEGISACRWEPFDQALALISYENAREVLCRGHDLVLAASTPAPAAVPPL